MEKEKSRKGNTKKYVRVNVLKELVNAIDENIVGKGCYKNRTEVIKEMIEKQLPQYIEMSKKPELNISYFPPSNPSYSFFFRL